MTRFGTSIRLSMGPSTSSAIYDDVKSATDVANLYTAGCQAGCGNMYMEVDRDTGAATLFNGLSPQEHDHLPVGSAKGALNGEQLAVITNNYDARTTAASSMTTIHWEITYRRPPTLLREQDPHGSGAEDGGVFAMAVTIPLGNIWTKSPFEDLHVHDDHSRRKLFEQQLTVPVFFVNGPERRGVWPQRLRPRR